MALRILQFGVVFAVGFYLGPASILAGAAGASDANLSIQLEDPTDVTVGRGQSATLRCGVQSQVDGLKISWLHNDKPIPINDTRRHVQDDGSLYFPKVAAGKKGNGVTGQYRCLARNKAGAVLSNAAKLRIASFDRDFTQQPSNLSVPESQPAVLFCNFHSVPAAQIKWEYNHTTIPLPHYTRYVPLPTGALLITKTHSSDAGLYRCIATNNLLKKTKHSKIVELSVSSKPTKIAAPTFLPLDILPNTTVLVGENIDLYCAVTGWPIPTVQWLNTDSIVVSNSSILELRNVSLRDSGNYTCVAYNSDGRITREYSVGVHERPYFNVTPVSKTYPSAKTVRLDCQAKGVPEPKISWLKNGKPFAVGGRIKVQPSGLVFSHTFTYDAGIYQCVAANAASKVWVAAQLVLATPIAPFPSPPENVQCRAFDDSTVCLTWRPPENVYAQAYSIYSFHAEAGIDVSGPEYVTNMTYHLASGLNSSTNYKFYIRLYSIAASDQSNTVTCKTGVIGNRNLRVKLLNETSAELTWSKISTDVPCDGTKEIYKVQWRRRGRSLVITNNTEELGFVISELLPSIEYEFRVVSSQYKNENASWILLSFGNKAKTDENSSYDSANATDLPLAPDNLEASPISARIVNLTWSDVNGNSKFYSVCCVNVKAQGDCRTANLIKSGSNTVQVDKLEPNTQYEFRVRAHQSESEFSPFSQPINITTSADVPSPVLHLKYKVVNETAACLSWQPPLHRNAKLIKYTILYTPDQNRPLEKWLLKSVPVTQKKTMGCWAGDEQTSSAVLADLRPDKQYTLLVRAVSEIGIGNLTVPILVSTGTVIKPFSDEDDNDYTPETQNTLGIIVGVSIALVCIVFCVSCILVRKQCLKTRALARARMTASSNYYPAIAHYASDGTSVQVRLESPFSAEIHEIEHLVAEEDCPTDVPSMTPTHLDSKGTDGFPNGHINGSAKPYMNGHLMNGHVHITENPRYNARECNGHVGKSKRQEGVPGHYEEDSNSNLKTSKFQDLHRLFENSKLQMSDMTKNKPNHQCNPHFTSSVTKLNDNSKTSSSFNSSLSSSEADSLDLTTLSYFDTSLVSAVNNHRRVSPLLGPNG